MKAVASSPGSTNYTLISVGRGVDGAWGRGYESY